MAQNNLFAHYKLPEYDSYITGLKLKNSLAGGELTKFIPIKGRQIKFYYCGPTVYSYTHLGHARTYVGIDVIRRTLKDYLGYDLISVMNITDIDDKIIKVANEQQVNFLEVTKVWEKEFFQSMESLNVQQPDVLTRVSDYVPEIITFIQKIIANGYGYVSNESVYFNAISYKEKHAYPKMRPQGGTEEEMLQGDGETQKNKQNEKKSNIDFVLWKKSQENEPKWDSPWGLGRPGWHIECSVMASEVLGNPIDLHAGGIDLQFPHHDNSIAQSEACFNCDQWINYFIHLGHLNIEGLKMGKSLKNFITIKEVLQRYTPRQIRLNFALHRYDQLMDYTELQMIESISKDKKFDSFLQRLNTYINSSIVTEAQKWQEHDLQLHELFRDRKAAIHEHILNNFDYPEAIKEVEKIITLINQFFDKKLHLKAPLLRQIHEYLLFFFNLLGLDYQKTILKEDKSRLDKLVQLRQDIKTHAKKKEFDQIIQLTTGDDEKFEQNFSNELVQIYNQFRQKANQLAKEQNFTEILNLTDQIRDQMLPNTIGVKVEDKQTESIWQQYDPNFLRIERESQIRLQGILAEKEQERLEKSKIPPSQLFLKDEKYSKFDNKGIPTHSQNGDELTKDQRNKLTQIYKDQEKDHKKYLKSIEKQVQEEKKPKQNKQKEQQEKTKG
ncbi:hypothetical protein pb186bvf_011448 [Paramecium bursaria]